MAAIEEILDLEAIDRDMFRGPAIHSELTRTFGGQVAAQALVAATRSIDDGKFVHSLHGYFIAPGASDKPTVYLVDRLRDGRSFSVRQVRGIQDGETIFSMQASFHIPGDHGIEHSDRMRPVPTPEELDEEQTHLPASSRAMLAEWGDWDIRVVHPSQYPENPYAQSQQMVWFRSKRALPDDPTFNVCTLAYMSDMTLLHCATAPHPGQPVQMASLDHAMWFLRPFKADEWLLYDQISPSAANGRALVHGRIFNRAGDLVAVVTQEGLTRFLQPGQKAIPLNTLSPEEA